MTAVDFNIVLPEVLLALYAIAALMVGVFFGKDRLTAPLVWLTAIVFVLIAVWIGVSGQGERAAFGGMFLDDPYARFGKIVILGSAAAVLVISLGYMARFGLMRFEYPVLGALAVLGMNMMVSAGDLMALYLGLELQSLSLYVLAAIRRESVKSSEAGLKYFVLGSLSSGILLYGASLIYGFTGTTLFSGIQSALGDGVSVGLLFGLVFVLAGLAFKISAVPFHMWTPDVYEGSPTPVTAFFAGAPKVAAMLLIGRVAHDAFGAIPTQWGQVLMAFAVLSMFLGSIAAIAQTDLKRLMAYSSITHMGYALIGIAVGTPEGIQAALIYMLIYVVMNVGTFALVLSLERDGRPVSDLASLQMFSKSEPLKALAVLALFFSLAGVPPFVGFFAKFEVLRAAVNAGQSWLAILGVVASVIGAFYYLRVVYYMYFGKEQEPADSRMSPAQWLALVIVAVLMLVGSINLFGSEAATALAAQVLVAG